MIDSGSISPQSAILQLEKLIGIERRSDFAAPNIDGNQLDQAHINALIMSEYAEEALTQIKCQLGYLPRRDVTFPSEPAIRQALFEYDFNHGNIDTLFDDCNPHIDDVYKRDMQPHSVEDYPKEIYNLYDILYPEFKHAARARIIKFARYEPTINSSIYAELVMRCRMIECDGLLGEIKTEADYEVQGVVWFRWNITAKH